MAAYLHDGITLYLDRLYDWDEYFRLRKGDGVDVGAEREALREVLATCAEICASIEPESRAGWYEAAKLENGQVVRTATGRNSDEVQQSSWDVRDLIGHQVWLQILDTSSAAGRYILADHLVQSAHRKGRLIRAASGR